MAADWDAQFGTSASYYVYATACGMHLRRIGRPLIARLRTADTPGMNRGYSAGGLLSPATFSIEGIIKGTSATNYRDRTDTFLAAHAPGRTDTAGNLRKFYPHSDRFRYAEVRAVNKLDDESTHRFWGDFDVEFYSADPLLYAETATSTSSLAAGGTITNSGQAATRHVTLTLAVGSIGTNGTIILTNTTTGEVMTITPDATGTFTIDCYAETVSRSSAYRPATFSGEWISLNPGANTLTVSTTGSASVSSLSCSHRNAWY